MTTFSRVLAIGTLVVAPAIASAQTVCNRNSIDGNWLSTTVNPDGSSSACDLTVSTSGAVSGICHSIDLSAFPSMQHNQLATGQFNFRSDCSFTGVIAVGSGAQAISVALEGRALSSRGSQPSVLMGAGYFEMGGIPFIQGITLHRRPGTLGFEVPTGAP